jgi:fumarate hydratase subunit alpha
MPPVFLQEAFMREVNVSLVENAVRDLCISANKILPQDLEKRICECAECEVCELPKSIMNTLKENMQAARDLHIPVCQDTGMAVVFLKIGQDVHFVG